jgi:hypothetical protein
LKVRVGSHEWGDSRGGCLTAQESALPCPAAFKKKKGIGKQPCVSLPCAACELTDTQILRHLYDCFFEHNILSRKVTLNLSLSLHITLSTYHLLKMDLHHLQCQPCPVIKPLAFPSPFQRLSNRSLCCPVSC